jgi:hypothetical protein
VRAIAAFDVGRGRGRREDVASRHGDGSHWGCGDLEITGKVSRKQDSDALCPRREADKASATKSKLAHTTPKSAVYPESLFFQAKKGHYPGRQSDQRKASPPQKTISRYLKPIMKKVSPVCKDVTNTPKNKNHARDLPDPHKQTERMNPARTRTPWLNVWHRMAWHCRPTGRPQISRVRSFQEGSTRCKDPL